MNSPEDQIDVLLRERNTYVDDGGFTARVVKSLPRRRRAWLRPALLLGTVAIGSMLAVWWLPWGNLPPLDLSVLHSLDSQVLMPWELVVSVVASLVLGVVSALERGD